MAAEPRRNPRLALLVAALLWPRPAAAVFVADEMRVVDAERLLDSEYFLDLLGFSYPLDWDRRWSASPRGYRLNAASLDRSDLLLDQALKLPHRLNDWLGFRYDLEHHGDKEVVILHNWIALEAGPWKGFSAGIFGEPTFQKEDADLGASLSWRPAPLWSLRAAVNAVDFPLNERGTSGQRYARKPYTYAFLARRELERGGVGAALELDMPLIREFAASGRTYRYRRTSASVAWDRFVQKDWALYAGYAYEFKREADDFPSPAAGVSQDFRREAHQVRAGVCHPTTDADRFELGGSVLVRAARTEFRDSPSGYRKYRRWEAMPYARWRRDLRSWLESETAVFLSQGNQDGNSLTEAKLGLGLDFVTGESGRIGLYGTFDIDDADRHLWDGGNARVMILF